MSKHFSFLFDTEYSNIAIEIEEIEKKLISNPDDNSFFIDCGIVLEKILNQNINITTQLNQSLSKLIKAFIDSESAIISKQSLVNPELENAGFNNVIKRALYFIRDVRNRAAHADNEKYSYGNNGISFKINALNALYCIMSYIIYERSNKKFNIEPFDENIYFEKLNMPAIKDVEKYNFNDLSIAIESAHLAKYILNKTIYFIIPEYQRKYVWTIDQCKDLYYSILEKIDKNDINSSYLGTMAFSSESSNEEKMVRVIDGQQRITTSLLLLIAIYNSYCSLKRQDIDNTIVIPSELKHFFENSNYTESKIDYRYIASKEKKELEALKFYLKLDKSKSLNEVKNMFFGTNVYNNYNWFYEEISTFDYERLNTFYETFYNKYVFAKIFFDIEKSSEMEIFEDLNSKGTDLSSYDLVKNHLFNCIENNSYKANKDLITKSFIDNFDIDHYKKDVKEDKVDMHYLDFLYNFVTYKHAILGSNENIDKNKLSILKNFKIIYKNNNIDFSEYKLRCDEIGKYFKIFMDIETKKYLNKSNCLNFSLVELQNLEQKDLSIVYFWLIDNLGEWDQGSREITISKENRKYFRDSLFAIEKWILFLIQVRGTGQSLKKSYLMMIDFLEANIDKSDNKDLENIPKLINNFISRKDIKEEKHKLNNNTFLPQVDEIQQSLVNKILQTKIQEAFLRRIQYHLINKSNTTNQNIFREKETIEHIMPKTLSKDWENMYKGMYGYSAEDLENKHLKYLDYLGNLLLIEHKSNSKLGNKKFDIKVKEYEKDSIVSICANINFTYEDRMRNVISSDTWKFEYIEERTKIMANMLINDIYKLDK
ncbi:DUF262 domain-containing HNH endonuclease family protein [Spiroplasma endosymbiont of Aspidapion aeneum]|uniref:DUF262 domain-containing protein n=1 Tax=Spiroplasma endosymbiont of Aspidapion aeneum TaxID=3066276 RepID=UPI00313E8DE5